MDWSIFKDSGYKWFLITALCFNFTWQMAWGLFNIYNVRYVHATILWISIFSVANQLVRDDKTTAERYTQAREFYRDDRDKFYVYAGLVYLANLLDAYISAHLFDFDVSDPKTSAYFSAPQTERDPWRLGMRMRF